MMFSVNTRIAPSPTGSFHLGTARTAYFNWLAARAAGGSFMLRIDDTDKSRYVPGAEDEIIESLQWLGIEPDQVVRQSDNFLSCHATASALLGEDVAIEFDGAIVFRPRYIPNEWNDSVVGTVNTSPEDRRIASQMVLMRSDGTPTYHFASVVNDFMFGIDWIIRGVDHISNTLRQICLFKELGKPPMFSHIGLVHSDGKKLSKRDGSMSVLSLRDQGYSPEAVLAFLLRLGWSHHDPEFNDPILKEDAIGMFLKDGSMKAKPSNIDMKKLDSIHRKLSRI